jgi:preprotein translocase subunit SecF
MFIIKYKTIFISISLFLVALSFIMVGKFGIKKGIDFTGGTVIEASYVNDDPATLDNSVFEDANIKLYNMGDKNYKFVSALSYEELTAKLNTLLPKEAHPYIETNVTSVGPTMGSEMTKKAIIAIIIVVFAILLFIAFSFRAVSYPVSSWKYGVIAMLTLVHDITVPTGAYVWMSYTKGAQVDTLFVVALLTILGISIADKIVVFDRIRENLKLSSHKKDFGEIVGMSLKQTFTRSINTSVTVVLALLALYVYGPSATKFFSLTLMLGMIVGTYSSIFVASPLLVLWNKTKKN